MFKKIIIIALIVVATTLTLPEKAEAAYPNGSSVGAALTGGVPFGGGLIVTGKFESVPVVFGLGLTGANYNFGYGSMSFFGINLTADWWGFKLPLGQAGDAAVTMYLGPGATLDLGFGTGSTGYFYTDFGIRMPIGFSFLVKQTWEIFIEPSIGLNIIGVSVNDGKASLRLLGSDVNSFSSGFRFNAIRFGFQFGFRYWF